MIPGGPRDGGGAAGGAGSSPRQQYRCPEDMCVLNELPDPCWVLSLEPSNSKTYWCNEAASRDFHNLDLAAEREGEVEVLMDQWYQEVQVNHKVLEFRKTFYPGGVPITMDCTLKPLKIFLQNSPQSQIAMMVIGKKTEIADQRAEEVNRIYEMMSSMKTHAMLFSMDGKLLHSNSNADNYYRHRDVGLPMDLRGIFQTMAWQNPDDLEAEYQKVISLCSKRTADEYVIEAERVPLPGSKKQDDQEKWHLLRFLASVDPISGQPVILATETDISQVKMQMRLQENFFATLCHELRTPLTGIIGLTDSILKDREMLPQDIEKKIDIIKSGGKRLTNLVCDIMDAASLGEQRLVVKQEHVNLPEVANNVMQMLSPILRKGVQLQNQVDPTLPNIVGDTNRIEQILTNLVGNSAKFTSKGHICISAFVVDQDHVAIEVSDTGIGIPQDKIGSIFGRFQQVDLATTRKYGGTGLGLSLVKSLVQAHNGRISVSSRMGKDDHGSKFTVILPINSGTPPDQHLDDAEDYSGPPPGALEPMSYGDEQDASQGQAQLAQANRDLTMRLQQQDRRIEELEQMLHGASMHGFHSGSSANLKRMLYQHQASQKWRDDDSDSFQRRSNSRDHLLDMGHSMRSVLDEDELPMFQNHSDLNEGIFEVLSVDDDPVNQLVIEGLLAPKGYVVTACLDGDEALTLLDERGYLPDVILLDCQMPGKTGFEVCLELRQQYPETLPVIMISANTEEENILKGFQVGSNDYVKKPFNGAEVLARIQTQLRLRDMWKAEVDATRSQELLNKMLPPHIMTKLKGGDCTMIAESHENVTILFSDIVGFTTIAAQYNTREIIVMLNEMFTEFDLLTVKHGVYKVQTIGDAYMIAAGHDEESRNDHYRRVFDFARDMLNVIQKVMLPDERDSLKIRIGIHSGPAYAGIVGVKCPRYCFFGDTVNTASRMESNGFPMTIHVSSQTWRLLSNECEWLDCGDRFIKGKGNMRTYLARLGDWKQAIDIHHRQLDAAAKEEEIKKMGYGDPDRLSRLEDFEKQLQTREEQLQHEERRVSQQLGAMEMQKESLQREIRDLEMMRGNLRTQPQQYAQDPLSMQSNWNDGGFSRIPSSDSAFQGRDSVAMEKAKHSLSAAQKQVSRLREEKALLQNQLEAAIASREETRRASANGRPHPMLDTTHTNGHPPQVNKASDSPTSSIGNRSAWQRDSLNHRGQEVSEMQKWLIEAVSNPDWYWAGSTTGNNDYEVSLLLKHLGLQHYSHALISEEVFTMSVLADMDEYSLEKIGIRTKASRLRILDGAKCIKQTVDLLRNPEPTPSKRGVDRSTIDTPNSYRSREFDSVSVPGAQNGHMW